ncbi:hypothetical protein [Wielerella bovis]|nr:hypothetical protein [Wielerella bovis]ULJ64134.1 hypothetical protein MIS33_08200 [Wielerella bovis]ULJ67951.1 hypothetical protein MIS31_05275 [Wielerella bovis]
MKKFASTALALTLATLGVACTPINHAINATPSTQTANISTAKEVGQL